MQVIVHDVAPLTLSETKTGKANRFALVGWWPFWSQWLASGGCSTGGLRVRFTAFFGDELSDRVEILVDGLPAQSKVIEG